MENKLNIFTKKKKTAHTRELHFFFFLMQIYKKKLL